MTYFLLFWPWLAYGLTVGAVCYWLGFRRGRWLERVSLRARLDAMRPERSTPRVFRG